MNVLICDDHPIVAEALSSAITGLLAARVHVVHSFALACETAAAEPLLDLCLMDLHIPGEDPWSSLQKLRALLPQTPIIVCSGSDDDDDLAMVLKLGLEGYLPKSAPAEVFEAAIRLVLAGGRYLPARTAEMLLQALPDTERPETSREPSEADGSASGLRLTPRQRTVLELISEGRSNKAIARILGISPATVKAHVAQVTGVLGAHSRLEAVARARNLGIL